VATRWAQGIIECVTYARRSRCAKVCLGPAAHRAAAAQVDLFVNFDCDLQAANLFERTLRALCRTVRVAAQSPAAALPALPATPAAALAAPSSGAAAGATGPGAGTGAGLRPGEAAASARPERHRAPPSAVSALLALLRSLDLWAAPLRESHATTVVAEQGSGEGSLEGLPPDAHLAVAAAPAAPRADKAAQSGLASGSGSGPGSGRAADGEVARFGAAKERKHSLEAGIAIFNRDCDKVRSNPEPNPSTLPRVGSW